MAPVNVLLPFDGAPAAQRALELLAGYRGDPSRLEVTLLGVQPPALDLEAPRAKLAAAGIAARAETKSGPPAKAIAEAARAHQLVVMGTRGAGALHGYSLGSVAMRVVHASAEAPVLLVKPDDPLPAAFGRRLRVLLATDGSPPALRAAERLAAWRDFLGELEVHVAWVQQPLTLLEAVLPPHDDLERQWSTEEGEAATKGAREVLARAGIAHKTHYSAGDVAEEIGVLAGQTGAELIVIGTRGLGAAHHALIGSVALKAGVLARAPAMLVP